MFKTLSLAAIMAAGALMAAPAMAHHYVVVDAADDGSMLRVLDQDSIAVSSGTIKQAWVMTMFAGKSVDDNVVRRHTLFLYDCGTPRSAFRQMEIYEQPSGAPADSWSHDDNDLTWTPVEKDTIGWDTRAIVCGNTVPDPGVIVDADNDDMLNAMFEASYADQSKK